MIDIFRQLKLDYKEYIILFKSGSFYICFDEDSVIVNKIFNYKIVELKNNIKVGFPLQKINNITMKLTDLRINYIIIEDKSIVKKKAHKHNNFSKYKSSVFEIISINNRINLITKKLKKLSREKSEIVLEKIEKLI